MSTRSPFGSGSLSASAEAKARETNQEAARMRREFIRANRAANRAQWWIDNGAAVAVVVVSFVATTALVALQVWLP